MAANSLQVDEKNKTTLKNLKEKYENDIAKLEQDNNELKVQSFESQRKV